ncbi:MAG: HlyC/CorC family transporter, partial [Oscillospiraceae bacterium]|nr:HlyC/CorC family transporter [Oscillospiraceae bacterium]
QELISIVDEIEDEGVLEEDEADLVQSAIEFNDIDAGEVLTPRVDICAIDKSADKEKILETFLLYNYSRMPVYEGSIDKIIGFINQKDFFAAVIKGVESPMESLIKPCLYVPPKMKIIDVMHMLQKDKVHMAVVTDEYGGTQGIVTLEDILEQLVGDIWDEHDEETQQIFKVDDLNYEVMGETTMDDVYEEILNTKNKQIDGYQTLSGYLMEKLERIPDQGDSFSDDYLIYTVKIVEDNRIKKVNIRIHQPEDFEI